jgi:hypothetical protein
VLEVGAGAERPVLIVEAASLRRGPRLEDDGVPALLGEHAREAPFEVGDVVEVQAVEAHASDVQDACLSRDPVYKPPKSC